MKTFAFVVLGLYFTYRLFAGVYLLSNWDRISEIPSEKKTIDAVAKGKKWVYFVGMLEHFILLLLTVILYYTE